MQKLVQVQKTTSHSHSSFEPPMHITFWLITKSQHKAMVNLYNETDWKGLILFYNSLANRFHGVLSGWETAVSL